MKTSTAAQRRPPAAPRRDADSAMSKPGFTQRVVSAAGAAPPPTTGLPSIFPASSPAPARLKRQHVPPLDVSKVVVRTDVPLPAPRSGRGNAYREANAKLLALMSKKGCSVELDPRHAVSFLVYAKTEAPKLKFEKRTLSDEVTGVWRVE